MSYTLMDDQQHKQPPCLDLTLGFVNNGAKKGWSQLLTQSNGEGAKTHRGMMMPKQRCQSSGLICNES